MRSSLSISRICNRSYIPIIFKSPFATRKMSSGTPSATAQAQKDADMKAPSTSDLGIENTDIKTAAGVDLSQNQKVIVGSVLDVNNLLRFQNLQAN